MRLTKQHVDSDKLDALIITAEMLFKSDGYEWYKCILDVALELKQRRAEEKQRLSMVQS